MSEETFKRAQHAAREIAERNHHQSPRVVALYGWVGGRESNPTEFSGHAVTYVNGTSGEPCLKFWPVGIREAERSAYVIDGRPMYVAGWQGTGPGPNRFAPVEDGYMLLHPYSAQFQAQFLPRRAYFLTTRSDIPALNGEAF